MNEFSALDDARFRALDGYAVLDSGAEQEFDDIVFLAAALCKTPVALVSLIDRDRQWFKARVGIEVSEMPLDRSICRHGLASEELLIIADLARDPRTADNPLVRTENGVRFYAGAPLLTPHDTPIGMLCVLDTEPRPEGLDAEQRRGLAALAKQVVAQLELRKALHGRDVALFAERAESEMLRRAARRLELAEQAGHVGAFEMDLASGSVAVSREFCRIYGIAERASYPRAELEARHQGDDPTGFGMSTSANGESPDHDEFRIRRGRDDQLRWVNMRGQVVNDDDGNPLTLTGIVTDVTDQHAINEEIAHRLKNTLAIVQAVAGHTLRGLADAAPVEQFNRRIAALATAHDILLSRTRASAGVRQIAQGVLSRLSLDERVSQKGEEIQLSSRVVLVLSMLLHELATNAMKYGALSVPTGTVALNTSRETREDGDWLVIDWQECGGPPVSEPDRKGLGIRLIERGLSPEGEVELTFAPSGFTARVAAPLREIAA